MSRSGENDQLARGAGFALVGKLLGRGSHVVGQIVLARSLGPAGFGLYAIGWTVLRAGGVILPLGLDKAVIRFGTAERDTPDRLRSVIVGCIGLALGSGLAAGAMLWSVAPGLAEAVFRKPDLAVVLRAFALTLPFLCVLKVAAATTLITRKTTGVVLTEDFGQPFVNLLLLAPLVVLGLSQRLALGAALASFVVAAAAAVALVWRWFPVGPRAAVRGVVTPGGIGRRELLRYSLPAMSAGMFTMLIVWADRLFVGRYLPAEAAGLYQAASQFSVGFAVILAGFSSIFGPLAMAAWTACDVARLNSLYRTTTRWALYLAAPLFAALVAAPESWLTLTFGPSYTVGARALTVLACGQLINVATGPVGLLLVLAGQERGWFVISGFVFVLNLALNGLLVPSLGIEGAAIATAVSLAVLFGLGVAAARRRLGVWPYDGGFAKIGVALVVALVAAAGTGQLLRPLAPEWVVAACVLAAAAASYALVVLRGGLPAEDQDLLDRVVARLRRRAAPTPTDPTSSP